jgi:hypothetical protein
VTRGLRVTSRTVLFTAIAAGLGVIAVAAIDARSWIVAAAAGVLAGWMLDVALREAGVRGRSERR